MKVKEIEAKSILSKTRIPIADYVINPYVGCIHSCVFCYARFMKRFTGHGEEWGEFLDVKINAPDLIPKKATKYKDKYIFLSSVTDPYLPLERKYQLTRQIIEKLIPLKPALGILTKSDLILRDIDLIKQFKTSEIGFSFSTLDEKIRNEVEPAASPVENRINALKEIHEVGIKTYVFISPILPFLTDWKDIIENTRNYADYFMFENLNVAGTVWGAVKRFLGDKHPDLVQEYKEIYSKNSIYWDVVEEEIIQYCKNESLEWKMYFHH
ncbi:radical SAM protein [Methanobacterium sp. ACI-7]|uniref:radical SAM protein n=1 Tax=unclassified Methanobacterium TaxID=2627676 RepID=UPI0039C1B097